MFKLINLIVLLKLFTHFEFDACNTFQKNWDSGMFCTLLHHMSFKQHSVSVWEVRTLNVEAL